MEPALQRRVQRYGWDKAAAYYDAFWHNQLRPAQDLLLEFAELRPGEKVLDLACGTGLVSFRASETVGADGFVLGTDISEKMIALATGAAGRGFQNMKFERMDAEDLRIEDGSFDVALCALGLMYVPDPVRALHEMSRVLRPGGRMVVAVWGRRSSCGWADLFEIVDRFVSSEVCPMFFNLGNPLALEHSAGAAHFSQLRSKRIVGILEYEDDEQACGAAFTGGPVALAYNKFSDAVKQEAHGAYLQSIKPYKNGRGYRIPAEFVVLSGCKGESL